MGVASLSMIPMTEITTVTEATASKIKAIKQIKKKTGIAMKVTIITLHQQYRKPTTNEEKHVDNIGNKVCLMYTVIKSQ